MEEYNNNGQEKINELNKKFELLLHGSLGELFAVYKKIINDSRVNKQTIMDNNNLININEINGLGVVKVTDWQKNFTHSFSYFKNKINLKINDAKNKEQKKILEINLKRLEGVIHKIKYWFFKNEGVELKEKNISTEYFNDLKDKIWEEDYYKKLTKKDNDTENKIYDYDEVNKYIGSNSLEEIKNKYRDSYEDFFDLISDHEEYKREMKAKKKYEINNFDWEEIYKLAKLYLNKEVYEFNFLDLKKEIKKRKDSMELESAKIFFDNDLEYINEIINKIWYWKKI